MCPSENDHPNECQNSLTGWEMRPLDSEGLITIHLKLFRLMAEELLAGVGSCCTKANDCPWCCGVTEWLQTERKKYESER